MSENEIVSAEKARERIVSCIEKVIGSREKAEAERDEARQERDRRARILAVERGEVADD